LFSSKFNTTGYTEWQLNLSLLEEKMYQAALKLPVKKANIEVLCNDSKLIFCKWMFCNKIVKVRHILISFYPRGRCLEALHRIEKANALPHFMFFR